MTGRRRKRRPRGVRGGRRVVVRVPFASLPMRARVLLAFTVVGRRRLIVLIGSRSGHSACVAIPPALLDRFAGPDTPRREAELRHWKVEDGGTMIGLYMREHPAFVFFDPRRRWR